MKGSKIKGTVYSCLVNPRSILSHILGRDSEGKSLCTGLDFDIKYSLAVLLAKICCGVGKWLMQSCHAINCDPWKNQLQSMYLIQKNVLGENPEQAEYTIVVVFTGFMEIFLSHGRCLIDKRMVLCLMHGARITQAQLQVSARTILRHWVSMNGETLRKQEHYSYTVLPEEVAGLTR